MISYAKTDTGLVRRSNQDFLFAADQPVGPLPNLFIVADGMGGRGFRVPVCRGTYERIY